MNIQNIVKEIKRNNEEERRRIKDRVVHALEEVERLKRDFLKIDGDMEKMILFGSLSEGGIDSFDFDIDLAVKSEQYYQLVGRALQSDFKVDVVDLDSVYESIRARIMEQGRVIYEKGPG